MTNKEVCEAFVDGTRNTDPKKNLYIARGVLYSYGEHWPLAIWHDGYIYLNCARYSVTTGKHRSQVIAALDGREYVGATLEQMKQLAKGR